MNESHDCWLEVSYDWQISILNPPTVIFLGGGRKPGEPVGNPHGHEENMQNSAKIVIQVQDQTGTPELWDDNATWCAYSTALHLLL